MSIAASSTVPPFQLIFFYSFVIRVIILVLLVVVAFVVVIIIIFFVIFVIVLLLFVALGIDLEIRVGLNTFRIALFNSGGRRASGRDFPSGRFRRTVVCRSLLSLEPVQLQIKHAVLFIRVFFFFFILVHPSGSLITWLASFIFIGLIAAIDAGACTFPRLVALSVPGPFPLLHQCLFIDL